MQNKELNQTRETVNKNRERLSNMGKSRRDYWIGRLRNRSI